MYQHFGEIGYFLNDGIHIRGFMASHPRPVMGKLRPAGQTRPPERFYPARDMIPNLTNEKKKN
jgi:hypothetical protein